MDFVTENDNIPPVLPQRMVTDALLSLLLGVYVKRAGNLSRTHINLAQPTRRRLRHLPLVSQTRYFKKYPF